MTHKLRKTIFCVSLFVCSNVFTNAITLFKSVSSSERKLSYKVNYCRNVSSQSLGHSPLLTVNSLASHYCICQGFV